MDGNEINEVIGEMQREIGRLGAANDSLRSRLKLLEQDRATLLAVRILMRGMLSQLDEGSE